MSKRAKKNLCLNYLAVTKKPEYLQQCLERFRKATNMTDSTAAVRALVDKDCEERRLALDEFYQKWKDERLVVNKWLTLQVPRSHFFAPYVICVCDAVHVKHAKQSSQRRGIAHARVLSAEEP